MERLYPQTPINNLVSATQANYNVAQNYYAQRKDAFRYFLWRNGISAVNITENITNSIKKIWNQEVYLLMNKIYFSGLSLEQKQKQVESHFNLSPEIMKHLLYAIKQGNPRTFYSGLGFAFEEWIADQGIGPIIKRGQGFANSHAVSLINAFVSGGLTSKASIVSGTRNIRPDILITADTKTSFQSDNGVLKSSSGLPVELQSTLDIDWKNAFLSPEDIMEDSLMLKEFLSPGKGDFYGISAKLWGNSNGKQFMQSSVMQKMFNATFNQTDSKGQRHSWEPDYTMEYVVYSLSHRIIDIVGPANVGLATRTGFIWMDDFLTSHIFYMQVQMESFWKKKDGGQGRYYPQITDPGIYIRNYNLGSATSFKARMNKRSKTKQNFITLKVS